MPRENDELDVNQLIKLKTNHTSMKTTDLTIFWILTSEWVLYSSKYAVSKWMNVWEVKYSDFQTKIISSGHHEKNLIVLTEDMKVYSYNMSDRSIVETLILSHPLDRLFQLSIISTEFGIESHEFVWNGEKYIFNHDVIGKLDNVDVFVVM